MGMFDYIRCRHALPIPGAIGVQCQTKDTPAQYLDSYEIRDDGTLWHQRYDVEDHSDPTATGLARIQGMLTRVNERWEQAKFTGEVVFYGATADGVGFEYSAYFVRGELKHLEQIEPDPTPPAAVPASTPPATGAGPAPDPGPADGPSARSAGGG